MVNTINFKRSGSRSKIGFQKGSLQVSLKSVPLLDLLHLCSLFIQTLCKAGHSKGFTHFSCYCPNSLKKRKKQRDYWVVLRHQNVWIPRLKWPQFCTMCYLKLQCCWFTESINGILLIHVEEMAVLEKMTLDHPIPGMPSQARPIPANTRHQVSPPVCPLSLSSFRHKQIGNHQLDWKTLPVGVTDCGPK